jgi:hypothetical protein
VAISVLVVIAGGMVAGSPVAMGWLATLREDWNTLSDVGQTYGLASAVLSGIALVSIGLSLAQQAKQTKIAQLQAARAMQMELFSMAYEHPELRVGWGASLQLPHLEWRQSTYTNLVFMYIKTAYLIGDFNDQDIRRAMANRFKTQLGRDFWAQVSDSYRIAATTRKERRFLALTNEEYQRALRIAPLPEAVARPIDAEERSPAPSPSTTRMTPIAVAFSAGAAIAWFVAGRRSSRRFTS